MKPLLSLFISLATLNFLTQAAVAAHHKGEHTHHQSKHLIEIKNAWVRPTPPGIENSAAYFTLKNTSDTAIELNGVNSKAATLVQIHEHTTQDGLMKMQQLKQGLLIEAGESVEFKPGGYHVMFIGLEQAIKQGESIEFELEFANGDTQKVEAFARKHGKQDGKPHKHYHH